MSNDFTRTPTGVVGSRYFFPAPILWVEGPTDIFFYEPIVGELKCTLKPFHGAANATALVDGLLDDETQYPYAVILDGDYRVLSPVRSVHRWVIWLRRYSFENYLWEKESLNRSCLKHAQCGEKLDIVGEIFEQAERDLVEKLRGLVELDIAARRSDPAPKVLPDRVDVLLVEKDLPDICPTKVSNIVAQIQGDISVDAIQQAKKDVADYLRTRRFSDLLCGHILLGVISRVVTQATLKIRGKKVILNDDGLMQLLSEMVWRIVPSKEHARLRRKIVSVVRELNAAQSTGGR